MKGNAEEGTIDDGEKLLMSTTSNWLYLLMCKKLCSTLASWLLYHTTTINLLPTQFSPLFLQRNCHLGLQQKNVDMKWYVLYFSFFGFPLTLISNVSSNCSYHIFHQPVVFFSFFFFNTSEFSILINSIKMLSHC